MKKVKRIESENQNAKKVKVENKQRRGSKKVVLIEIALPNRIYVEKLQKSTTTVRRRWDIAIFVVVSN